MSDKYNKGLKNVAYKKNHFYFTKDEFLAFCYWQSKINHLILLNSDKNSSCNLKFLNKTNLDNSLSEIQEKLSATGFEMTKDELEKYMKE